MLIKSQAIFFFGYLDRIQRSESRRKYKLIWEQQSFCSVQYQWCICHSRKITKTQELILINFVLKCHKYFHNNGLFFVSVAIYGFSMCTLRKHPFVNQYPKWSSLYYVILTDGVCREHIKKG